MSTVAVIAAIIGLLAVEAIALWRRRVPITGVIREWNRVTGGLVALLFGVLMGHFFFCGESSVGMARAGEQGTPTVVVWYCQHGGLYYAYRAEARVTETGAPIEHWSGGYAQLRMVSWLRSRYPGQEHFPAAQIFTQRECTEVWKP